MKKFILFALISCFSFASAFADDTFYIGGKRIGCRDADADPGWDIQEGNEIVTMGYIFFPDKVQALWSPHMVCHGGDWKNDWWENKDPNWCDFSDLRDDNNPIEHARYCLCENSDEETCIREDNKNCRKVELLTSLDYTRSSLNGLSSKNEDSCLYAECQYGYKQEDNACVPFMCDDKPFGHKEEYQKCSENRIKNGGLYCNKECRMSENETSAGWFEWIVECQDPEKFEPSEDGTFCEEKAAESSVEDDSDEDAESSVEDDEVRNNIPGCVASRQWLGAEAKACCYVKSSIANWDGQKCKCLDGGNFVMATNGMGGSCVPVSGDDVVVEQVKSSEQIDCEHTDGAYWNGKSCQCEKIGYTVNGRRCVESEDTRREREVSGKIKELKSASEKLEKTIESFGNEKSVWKNKDGNFNTARLASDSIAGVVLGTAGGLITSHVVKKNQEKSGFEDMSCTVGGQEIGGYGDQITVGIR